MRVNVTKTTDDLERDMRGIAVTARKDMTSVVREAGRVGNDVAKENARRSSGKHAKLYPGTFRAGAVTSFYGFGGGEISVEYGPIARGQGMLASILENGTRNNPPHGDLARSADLMGPVLAGEVRKLPGKWFW